MTLREAIGRIHERRENMLANMREEQKNKNAQMARYWRAMADVVWGVEGILLQVPECEKFILELHGVKKE